MGPRAVSKWVRPIDLMAKYKKSSTKNNLLKINWTDQTIDWDDRIQLQNRWNLAEKGWRVEVEWKMTQFGMGVFAKQKIVAGTVLRTGVHGYNLLQFQSMGDIHDFCQTDEAKWRYLADYLWGLYYRTNESGYPVDLSPSSPMFIGMWIPGNGLNHKKQPNTIYQFVSPDSDIAKIYTNINTNENATVCLHLVALREILQGEELFDDYRRHGKAPLWLQQLAHARNLKLNFKDCNDFVKEEEDDDDE